jgi:hypothetical protein
MNKDMENLTKKESNRNPGNKKSFHQNKTKQNKKHSGRPLLQTRQSGTENHRTQR